MRLLYSLLLLALWPLVFMGFVWRYGLRRTLAGLAERAGGGAATAASDGKARLWVHAASVGEVRAVEPLLRALPARFPGLEAALTTTTLAGKDLALKLGLAREVRLAPLDLPFCVRRLACRWKPRALLLVETELWPNWIHALGRQGVPMMVVNGRISDKSYRSYFLLRFFWAPLLSRLARVAVQSPRHASRFIHLGADPDRVSITGNLKYDAPLPDPGARPRLAVRYGFYPSDKIWVCGSIHPGEEEPLLDVLLALRSKGHPLKMVLAPRHVERAPELAEPLTRKGLSFALRSKLAPGARPDVLVLDTVGELAEVYGLAVFAFVGGSLVPRGGQNPLEPARWGVPVVFGPHMENFQEMADLFIEEKAAAGAAGPKELEETLSAWLRDPAEADLAGRAALRAAESQRGATESTFSLLSSLLSEAPPAPESCGAGCGCHG